MNSMRGAIERVDSNHNRGYAVLERPQSACTQAEQPVIPRLYSITPTHHSED